MGFRKRLFFLATLSCLGTATVLSAAPGDVDPSFDAGSVVFGHVYAVAPQSDGKVIIGGEFGSGVGGANTLARLNADGRLDHSFNPPDWNGQHRPNVLILRSVAIQSDGKLLVAGTFIGISNNGSYIARLDTDGSLDSTFKPRISGYGVNSIAVQKDGKVLVGGFCVAGNGTNCTGITRVNTDGTLDSTFNPGVGANGSVNSIAVQSDGKVLLGGNFTKISGTNQNRIARLNPDGSLDSTFNPGAGANVAVLCLAIQIDGKVLVGGSFTTFNGIVQNRIARLNTDGSLDGTFDPGKGASADVNSIAVRTDGKVLVGGNFISINGTNRICIARLNPEGSLDTTFNPGTGTDYQVLCLAVRGDKVIVGGQFGIINGTVWAPVGRLNADGTLDSAFDPGGAPNDTVYSLAMQADGRILIAGTFSVIEGTNWGGIARLNTDGSLDRTFNPGTGANKGVRALAVQPDGKILIGGFFTSINGTSRNHFARLNADGSTDPTFNPGTGANDTVWFMARQIDGKVLVGGGFTALNGAIRNRIARVNPDGSLDTTFNPGTGADGDVTGIGVQADGKVLVVGEFTTINGAAHYGMARLYADGSLDSTFNPSPEMNSLVGYLVLQSDGKILVGGYFTNMVGTSRNSIARLNTDGSLDSTFKPATGPGASVYSITVQPDNKVVLGFSGGIARFNPDGSLDSTFHIPRVNGSVNSVAVLRDGKLLLTGGFVDIGGLARATVARLVGGPIALNIQDDSKQAVLSWGYSAFALQSAPVALGTYTNVPGATSPYTNQVRESQQYFRLRAEPVP